MRDHGDERSAAPDTKPLGVMPQAERALSFDAVYACHAGFVFRVLRGMGVPDSVADDALQDVFLVVYRRLAEFDGRARITTWLFSISLHVARNYRRKHRRIADCTPVSGGLPSHVPSPAEALETARDERHVLEVLQTLDEDKRQVLFLADIEGLSAPEIAVITSLPLNTVYTRLRRARQSFARGWKVRKSHVRDV